MSYPGGYASSTPKLSLVCPHCGTGLQVDASQAGAVCQCPACLGKFQAPIPSAPVAGGPFAQPDPAQVKEFASKKIAAGVCGILLGGLGVHKFILGLNSGAVTMLVISLLGGLLTPCTFGLSIFASIVVGTIGLVEGIIYLTKSDQDFYQTYAVEKKQWF